MNSNSIRIPIPEKIAGNLYCIDFRAHGNVLLACGFAHVYDVPDLVSAESESVGAVGLLLFCLCMCVCLCVGARACACVPFTCVPVLILI